MATLTQLASPLATKSRREVWGIVGGMGPLASAEFLRTIYEFGVAGHEQTAPIVILISDPTFPDRTEYLLSGQQDILLEKLEACLTQLALMGATKMVICCLTIHQVVPRLPEQLRRMITPLVDVSLAGVIESNRTHLLLCTTGTRESRLFERHPLWEKAKRHVIMPDSDDQESIHQLIYELKGNHFNPRQVDFLDELMRKYQTDSFVAGCTEIHLLSRYMRYNHADGWSCIDPLLIIARQMAADCHSVLR